MATHEINIYMFKGFDDDKLCLERFPKKDMDYIRIHCQPCHTCLGKKTTPVSPPLETQAPKKYIAAEQFLGAGVPQENNHKTQMVLF